jgi:hypothetical protein
MRKLNKVLMSLAAFVLLLGGVGQARAGAIGSRAALQALLGGPGTLEDFEAFSIASGSAVVTGVALLNSTTIVNGQGPGLVVPGVDFTFGTGLLQWDGAGYFGSPSKEILSGAPAGQPISIDWTASPVRAFGIDLRAFTGFGATATMLIFGPDHTTLIGTLPGVGLPDSGVPLFVGWEDAGGIGKVSFTQLGQPWSPIIDNLEFGGTASVPEPTALTLLGIGLAGMAGYGWRRRKQAVA